MEMYKIAIYIVIILSIIIYILSKIHNKIKTYILKINSIEMEIDENLREKYDLISKINATTEKTEDEDEPKDELEEIKKEDYSSFEFERKLVEMEIELLNKNEKNEDHDNMFYKVNSINTKLIANKKHYNENITNYNSYISRFPGKSLTNIMKFKLKKYFDGKDMYDKNEKDFKF